MSINTHIGKQEEAAVEKSVQLRDADPSNPKQNQLWVNKAQQKMKFFDGTVQEIAETTIEYNLPSEGMRSYISQANKLSPVSSSPSAGEFLTEIEGRKPILDDSNSLKAVGGIERILFTSVAEIQDEFGPNGEPVYEIQNRDSRVRYVGQVVGSNGSNGSFVQLSQDGHLEVVAYCTGLNLLHIQNGGSGDFRVTVDEDAEGSNFWNSSGSSVITGQGYSSHQIQNLASGLDLGIHRFKIRAVSGNINIQGIEIVSAPAEGPELVTNGTFDTDISGWDTDGATWQPSGKVRTTLNGSRVVQQAINVEPGYIYRVEAEADVVTESGNGVAASLRILDNDDPTNFSIPNDDEIVRVNPSGQTGGQTYILKADFKAVNSTIVVGLNINNASDVVDWDNITIKKVQELSIAPGSAYCDGNLKTLSTIQDSLFTNQVNSLKNGGRVVKYITDDDTLGEALTQCTDAEGFQVFREEVQELSNDSGGNSAGMDIDREGDIIAEVNIRAGSGSPSVRFSEDGGDTFKAATVNFGGTHQNMNDSSHWFIFSPTIKVFDGNKVAVAYGATDNSINVCYGQISGGALTLSAPVEAIDSFSSSYKMYKLDYRAGKLYAYGVDNITNNAYVAVSSDDGATWATETIVKDSTLDADIEADGNSTMFVVDNEDSGNRICVIGHEIGSNKRLRFYYSDDDGVTWENAITIADVDASSGEDALYGYALSDDKSKLALLHVNRPFNANHLYLVVCQDLTVATPAFGSGTRIDDNVGPIEFEGGSAAGDTNSMRHHSKLNHKIVWSDTNSLYIVYDRADGGGWYIGNLVKIPNASSISPVRSFHSNLTGSNHTIESQLIKSTNGTVHAVYKILGGSRSNALIEGRVLAKKIVDDSPTSVNAVSFLAEADIIEKPSVTSGGFAGRTVVNPDAGGSLVTQKIGSNSQRQSHYNGLDDLDCTRFLDDANHSKEEIAQRINFRDFGRGSEFATLTSTSNRSFTLDDGTTTLVGDDVRVTNPSAGGERLGIDSNPSFVIFTFVGTGLDIEYYAQNAGTLPPSNEITVNGESLGAFPFSTVGEDKFIFKIVSGLPYGTHTVKIEKLAAGGTANIGLTDFIIYQPKKPSIPAEACELADYNVMAKYKSDGLTGDILERARGVISKNASREYGYIGSWSIATGTTNRSGNRTVTTSSSAEMQYTFYGTGFILNLDTTGSGSRSYEILIDGVANDTGVGIVGTTNNGSGNYTTSNNQAGVLEFTELPLGLHTITIRVDSTSNFTPMIDIITPIHIQPHSLKTGSLSFMDTRAMTPVIPEDYEAEWGDAKAWLVYDSINNKIIDSFNIAQVVDSSPGYFFVYWEVPFKHDPVIIGNSGQDETGVNTSFQPPLSHAVRFDIRNSSGTLTDARYNSLVVFGELQGE